MTRSRTVAVALGWALALLTALPIEARVRVALGSISQAGLVVTPVVRYESALLTVVGEGQTVFRARFGPGEPLSMAPVDREGHPLIDGSYRWEVRLAVAGLEGPEVLRASGRFRVAGGAMVAEPPPSIGTDPEGGADLVAAGTDPSVIFTDTTGGDDDYSIDVDGDVLSVSNTSSATEVLTVTDEVVGLFTTTPEPDMELHIVDGTADLRLESSSGSWDIRAATNDLQFWDSDELFDVKVMEIEESGSTYVLAFDGNGVFEGDFTAGSSREIKRDLEPAEPAELLRTLRDLPLYSWSYKHDREPVRHLGPMAEDFFQAFGLGPDDAHISPSDTSGLALAAIQALAARLEERDREIAELRRRVEQLESGGTE